MIPSFTSLSSNDFKTEAVYRISRPIEGRVEGCLENEDLENEDLENKDLENEA